MRFHILLTCAIFVVAASIATIQNIQEIPGVIQIGIAQATSILNHINKVIVPSVKNINVDKTILNPYTDVVKNIQSQVSTIATTLTAIQGNVDPVIAATPSGSNLIRAPVDKVQSVIKDIKTVCEMYRSISTEVNLLTKLTKNEEQKLIQELSAVDMGILSINTNIEVAVVAGNLNKAAADMDNLVKFLESSSPVDGNVTFDVAATIKQINDIISALPDFQDMSRVVFTSVGVFELLTEQGSSEML